MKTQLALAAAASKSSLSLMSFSTIIRVMAGAPVTASLPGAAGASMTTEVNVRTGAGRLAVRVT